VICRIDTVDVLRDRRDPSPAVLFVSGEGRRRERI
jgi:hypothetical protein